MLTLKTKDINISTGGPLIAILNRLDAEKLDIQALDRIKLQHSRNSIIAAIDISETNEISFGNVFWTITSSSKIIGFKLNSLKLPSSPLSESKMLSISKDIFALWEKYL